MNKQSLDLNLFREKMRRMDYNGQVYFSVVDGIEWLTGSPNPRKYWSVLKGRLKAEGAQATLEEIIPFRLLSKDGKLHETDCATRQTFLRLLQSIPSKNAEPFKVGLAALAEEHLVLIEDHLEAERRLRKLYRDRQMPETWIEQRIKVIVVRNALTDEWLYCGAHAGEEFALLTNVLHEGAFGLPVQAHRDLKGLPKNEDLRDHMSIPELGVTAFTESIALTLHQQRDSYGMSDLTRDAREAGEAGAAARHIAEQTLGQPVVTSDNFLANHPRRQVRGKKQKQAPSSQPPLLESGE
jgi:DNA-damage-inducible protein D